MKYWRGYLVAGIIGLFSWLLIGFASSHVMLMDMVYPYITRLLQNFLAGWSGAVSYSLADVLVTAGWILVIGTAVLMVILRWNPIQWFGWVVAALSLVFFLNTVIYGLNVYSGPISNDIRLQVSEYTLEELQSAAIYYREQANALAEEVTRDANGVLATDFDAMTQEAVNSYNNLVKKSYSIYAGVNQPVKKLADPGEYTDEGLTGNTVPVTGEAVVNPEVPGVGLPFAICHEMAHRMCIPVDRDADISAFMACSNSDSVAFRYSAYVMAYRTCYQAMLGLASPESRAAADQIHAGVHEGVYTDMLAYDRFVQNAGQDYIAEMTGVYLEYAETPAEGEEEDPAQRATLCDLLVSWHIQEVVLPMEESQNSRFDPFDENQVDLSGIVNAKVTAPAGG